MSQLIGAIKKFLSYSKARYTLHLDENFYYEISGIKAKLMNFINILYTLIGLKTNKIYIGERIAEIPFLYKNLNFKKVNKILDLGCVGSKISLQLATLGYDIVGIDMRPYLFKHRNIKFIQGNFLEIDLPLESFDCIICISTLEHIGLPAYNIKPFKDGDEKTIVKMHKILKKGGSLILTVPFGKGIVGKFERNYNSNKLKNLLQNFEIQALEIYEKHDYEWILGNENSNNSLKKVACIHCIK